MAARIAAGVRARAPRTREEAIAALVTATLPMMSQKPRALDLSGRPACILVYGVNGAGKTTTIGKLARFLRVAGRKPLVVAADTYRAAGIEQMTRGPNAPARELCRRPRRSGLGRFRRPAGGARQGDRCRPR
jgi:signal recognition particle GTPase